MNNLTVFLQSVINSTKEITDTYFDNFITSGHYEKVVALHHLFKGFSEEVKVIDSCISESNLTVVFPYCKQLFAFVNGTKTIQGRDIATYNILIDENGDSIKLILS